jgi:polysaccharide biosynthesis/export protein
MSFATAIRFSLIISSILFASRTEAQELPTGTQTGPLTEVRTDDCGCRNNPGGYPCLGGCQNCIGGVDCACACGSEARWADMRRMDFSAYGPGDYAGPARFAHLGEYRLRPNDQLQVIYLITRRQKDGDYKLVPGDEIMIESVADADLSRGQLDAGLMIQPDGSITVRLLGQVPAAGLTVNQLRELLDEKYSKFYEEPAIDVTPVKTNTLAEDIRNAVGG